jgi:Peptidase family M23
MTPCLAFLFLLSTSIQQDTMLLPVYGGRIISTEDHVKSKSRGLFIRPSVDDSVRSCSDGKVQRVWQIKTNWCITITVDDTSFTYAQMDTFLVHPGELVSMGDVIGERRMIPNDYNSIIFIVFLGNKELDPRTFILYKNQRK